MNLVLIGGSAALVLMLVAVFVVRRRKSVEADPPASVPDEQPQRRRSVGPAPAPSVTELAEEVAPNAELPVAPRRRVPAIGRTVTRPFSSVTRISGDAPTRVTPFSKAR